MPLPSHPFGNRTIVLPMRYLPDIHYYAAMAAYGNAIIDTSIRFDKRQKSTHRCTIADTHGTMNLTVPIEKPVSMSGAKWNDIVISAHGQWWNIHLTALKSAYGRTPFFEYYLDDFKQFYTPDCAGLFLADYNVRFDALLRRLLGISTKVDYSYAEKNASESLYDDYRHRNIDFTANKEYYQIWGLKHGFHPSLSIVDLLFNMGPEAQLVLNDMINAPSISSDL